MSGPVRTVELGQFTDDNAMRIAAQLDTAGIVWWHKTPGRFTRLVSAADWGVRLYVDADRLADARALAHRVVEG